MKVAIQLTIELDDTQLWEPPGADQFGDLLPTGEHATRVDVANHVVDAVSRWGGQLWPGHPFWPSNIRRVRAKLGDGTIIEEM